MVTGYSIFYSHSKIIFLQTVHKRHSIAHPWEHSMEHPLYVHSLIYILHLSMYNGVQGPIQEGFFHRNLNLMEISFCSHPNCNEMIVMKFCSDMKHYNWVTLKPNCQWIWIMMKISFVKWAPGAHNGWLSTGKTDMSLELEEIPLPCYETSITFMSSFIVLSIPLLSLLLSLMTNFTCDYFYFTLFMACI